MKRFSNILIILLAGLLATSCVSSRRYNAVSAELMRTESGRVILLKQVETQRDTVLLLRDRLAATTAERNELDERYKDLLDRYERYLADNSAEASRMLRELLAMQDQVQHAENQRQNAQTQLQTVRAELQDRDQNIAELEAALRNRESILLMLRNNLSDALFGFEGNGLTVAARDGKVYVSMEEVLLFRSASFNVEPEGARAVRELARVLAQNPDINVLVEGHTDNVPYRPRGHLLDNLDLSVKRATSVTRLLLENKGINPSRITSAGRGDSMPLDPGNSAAARQRNRRTEIILTPRLDELVQIMEGSK